MTTIVGVYSAAERGGVVLTSDLQGTRGNQKINSKKLFADKNKELVVGISGIFDERSNDLIGKIIEGKVDMRKVVKDGFFEDWRNSNISRLDSKLEENPYVGDGRLPNARQISSLLLATRFNDNPCLYTCWPMGRVERRGWTSIGTGSERANKYLEAKSIVSTVEESTNCLNSAKEGLDNAVNLSYNALKYATDNDIFSSGMDLVIVEKEGIKELGSEIYNKDLEREAIEKIMKQYE